MITFEQFMATDDYTALTDTILAMSQEELKAQVEETISWEERVPDCKHMGSWLTFNPAECLDDKCTGQYLADVQYAAADWQDSLE